MKLQWTTFDGTLKTLPSHMGMNRVLIMIQGNYFDIIERPANQYDFKVGDCWLPILTPEQCAALGAALHEAQYIHDMGQGTSVLAAALARLRELEVET